MNIRAERLRQGTTKKLAVRKLQLRYPKMNPFLLSKAEAAEMTGITLTREALLLLFPDRKPKCEHRRFAFKITVRMDSGTFARLQRARQGRSVQDYVYKVLCEHLEEHAQ